MPYLIHQKVKFHYAVNGKGIPLLFLHGLGGDSSQCRPMLQGVQNACKVTMDVRGHGESHLGPAERLSFDQFARDAFTLMEHLEIQRFIAGGISMGAGIAVKLALVFPEHISALILIRPAWLNKPCPENLRVCSMVGQLLKSHPLDVAKRFFLNSDEYRRLQTSAPATADSLLNQFNSPHAKEHAERLIRIPASVPFSKMSDLARIRAKTLILATTNDPVHPLQIARELSCRIRDSRLVQVTSKAKNPDKYLSDCSQQIGCFLKRQTNRLGRFRC